MQKKDWGIFVCLKLLRKHLRKRTHKESNLCFETGSNIFFITFPTVWKSSPPHRLPKIFSESSVPKHTIGTKRVLRRQWCLLGCSRAEMQLPLLVGLPVQKASPALTGLGLNFHVTAQFWWIMALDLCFLFMHRNMLRKGTGEMLEALSVSLWISL